MKKLILITFLLVKSANALLVEESIFRKYQRNTLKIDPDRHMNQNEYEKHFLLMMLASPGTTNYTLKELVSVTQCIITDIGNSKVPLQAQVELEPYAIECYYKVVPYLRPKN